MADRIDRKTSRNDFADSLADLAEQIRSGHITAGKRSWTVPGELETRIRLKEKKGRMELKLSCRWSTLGDYTGKERQKVDDWHRSMKTVKKRMGSSFQQITRAAGSGSFPDPKSVQDFVATSKFFAESAEPEWQDAMAEYMDHLENFIRAVEARQHEVMLHEIRDLQYRMKACHREFK